MAKQKILLAFSSKSKFKSTAQYYLDASYDLGLDVAVITDDDGSVGRIDANLESITKFSPDIVLYIEGGDHAFLPECIFELSNIPVVGYLIDTHMKSDEHVCLSALFSNVFLAQREYIINGLLPAARWLPLAAPQFSSGNARVVKDIDVCFVGSMDGKVHPERVEVLREVQAAFPNSIIGEFPSKTMGTLYSRAKIVLNWSVNHDLNMRIFEGVAAGAVVVSNYVPPSEIRESGLGNRVVVTDRQNLVSVIGDTLYGLAKDSYDSSEMPIYYKDRLQFLLSADLKRAQPISKYTILGAALSVGNYQTAISILSRKAVYKKLGYKSEIYSAVISRFFKILGIFSR